MFVLTEKAVNREGKNSIHDQNKNLLIIIIIVIITKIIIMMMMIILIIISK